MSAPARFYVKFPLPEDEGSVIVECEFQMAFVLAAASDPKAALLILQDIVRAAEAAAPCAHQAMFALD